MIIRVQNKERHPFGCPSRCFGSLVGRLPLQLPVVVATPAAIVVAAATGCLGLVGHDVRCNVLHLLSLLVQGKLLRLLGFAFLCRDSAMLKISFGIALAAPSVDADGCAKRPLEQVGSQHVLGGHLSAPVLGFAFLCRDSA